MKSFLINYATQNFFKSQKLNSITGIQHGFDSVIQWRPEDIDVSFMDTHGEILSASRGAGYWLWKPYFIEKTLSMVSHGDVVFYSDAGAAFDKDISPLLKSCLDSDEGITTFQLAGGHTEGEYTRKSVMTEVGVSPDDVRHTNQHMASFCIFKKTTAALEFLEEWISYCQKPEMITDVPSSGDTFPEFKDHRHDQSILSLLIKKNGLSPLADPTQWGLRHNETFDSDYFINHHRNNSSITSSISL